MLQPGKHFKERPPLPTLRICFLGRVDRPPSPRRSNKVGLTAVFIHRARHMGWRFLHIRVPGVPVVNIVADDGSFGS